MLPSKKTNLDELDREHLISLLEYFRSKLGKKADQLKETRNRLNNARTRIDKLKATVAHQRTRIMELIERDIHGDRNNNGRGGRERIK